MPAPRQPAPTPPPAKRRKVVQTRQVIADQAQVASAEEQCQVNSGNYVYSCFPTASTVVQQGEWASFVWNSRRPELTQLNLVNIYLFRADSQQQVLEFRNQPNPTDQAGLIRAQVDDRWFGTSGLNWNGKNVSYPFYWVIIRSDKTLDGNQVPQPIFSAVQTTVLDSVAASSSSAAAASSSSAASASRASASSRSLSPSSTSGANVQHGLSESGFPRWAIAVIVILGFLAITATCILAFLILRRMRRRRRRRDSIRNSMGSNSPMILNQEAIAGGEMRERYDAPGSPLLPPPSAALAAGGGTSMSHGSFHDAASTDSGGPFSGADAAIMAQAFRTTLRKPDFAGRPVEEGESPEQNENGENGAGGGGAVADPAGSSALSKELAEEGKDIRSVSSSREVRVEKSPPPEPGEPR